MAEFGRERFHQLLPFAGDAEPTFAVNVGALRLLEGLVALLPVELQAMWHNGTLCPKQATVILNDVRGITRRVAWFDLPAHATCEPSPGKRRPKPGPSSARLLSRHLRPCAGIREP